VVDRVKEQQIDLIDAIASHAVVEEIMRFAEFLVIIEERLEACRFLQTLRERIPVKKDRYPAVEFILLEMRIGIPGKVSHPA
jgi:hypothetical protein